MGKIEDPETRQAINRTISACKEMQKLASTGHRSDVLRELNNVTLHLRVQVANQRHEPVDEILRSGEFRGVKTGIRAFREVVQDIIAHQEVFPDGRALVTKVTLMTDGMKERMESYKRGVSSVVRAV